MFFGYVSKTLVNCICVSCISASLTYNFLHYMAANKNKIKVLFYRPQSDMKCLCHQKFDIKCTADGCSSIKTKEIVNCLLNAQKTIDVCVFAISNEAITHAIINAKNRGVKIRIIICNCILMNSKEVQWLRGVGIEVKYQKDTKGYMHNKYSVVDSTWLIEGSMNWTRHATIENWENVIITNMQSLVEAYSKSFEKFWTII